MHAIGWGWARPEPRGGAGWAGDIYIVSRITIFFIVGSVNIAFGAGLVAATSTTTAADRF